MRLRLLCSCAAASVFIAACSSIGQADFQAGRKSAELCQSAALSQAINSTGPVPQGCARIEGGQIGLLPQTVNVNGTTVTLTAWQPKTDSPGEEIGFSFSSTAPVEYVVKCSTQTFAGNTTSWTNPYGTSGPTAHAISNITFCQGGGADAGTPDAGDTFNEGPVDAGAPPVVIDAGNPGGECLPADAGTSTGIGDPCSTNSDCINGLTCVAGSCQIVIP